MKCYEKENVFPKWWKTFSFEQIFDISSMQYAVYASPRFANGKNHH